MLKGELVQLKAPDRSALPAYVEWLNDQETRGYLAIESTYPLTMAEETNWYESMLHKENDKAFAIHTLADDVLIGNVGFHNISWKNQAATVGIFIGNKNYWGKGYGTEAMRLALYIAFQELNLRRVELGVFAFNSRAARSYEKLGFVVEGRKRQWVYRDGIFHDVIEMSMLKEEYLERYLKEDEKRWQEL